MVSWRLPLPIGGPSGHEGLLGLEFGRSACLAFSFLFPPFIYKVSSFHRLSLLHFLISLYHFYRGSFNRLSTHILCLLVHTSFAFERFFIDILGKG